MTVRVKPWLCLAVALCAGVTSAEEPWETVQTEPMLIKTRARAGTDVKEVWAEGDLDVSPIDIQLLLLDSDRHKEFSPYMTESKSIGEREPDGATYTYAKLDLPVLSARDFVHKGYLDRDATKDKEGVFQTHWFAVPDKVPQREGVIRLKISEGTWKVTPKAGGKSHAINTFAADPGGSIPTVLANRQNARSCWDMFRNIEKEARKRAKERSAAAAPKP